MKQTTTKQGDLLHTQSNVEETPNNKSTLITHNKIEGTPFYVTGNEEKGYFIRLGDYKISEAKQTEDEAIKDLEENKWNIMVNIIATVVDLHDKFKLITTEPVTLQ